MTMRVIWTKSSKTRALGRDCLKVAEELILKREWVSPKTISIWRNEAMEEIERTVNAVQREPGPDPYKEDWRALSCKHLMETFGEA